MKKLSIVLAVVLASTFISCNTKQLKQVTAQRDSLLVVTQQQDAFQAEVDDYMETLASTLDSIKTQESILTVRKDESGRPLQRKEIMNNLQTLGDVIQRQRERIEELDAKLVKQGKEASHYRTVIAHLRTQIEEKDAQIAQMRDELNRKEAAIANLNTKVNTLEKDVADYSSKNKEQEKTIAAQAEMVNKQSRMLNTGYVFTGTSKDIKKAGLKAKGVLKGGQLNPEGLDMGIFKNVDTRSFKELKLKSERPKLLTTHPKSSYTIREEEDADGYVESCTLIIKDAKAFWSVSSYLVIQL